MQVLAPADILRKKPPSLLYFKSPENVYFCAAENICCLLSAPCSDVHASAQLPQALSRSNSLNSQLLSKDTCLLFLAIVAVGDSHLFLKKKTGAKQLAELELEHTLSSPKTLASGWPMIFSPTELLPLSFYKQGEESRPLEVDYYPVNGTFNLHYFPYYGKKSQVGASVFNFSSFSLCKVKRGASLQSYENWRGYF